MKLYETINSQNWLKGKPRDGNGRKCTAAHFWEVYPNGNYSGSRALKKAVLALYPERVGDHPDSPFVVAQFNDHPETTLEDVLRVCKFADV